FPTRRSSDLSAVRDRCRAERLLPRRLELEDVQVAPLLPFGVEPALVPRWDEPAGRGLLLCGPDRQVVGVFVLRVAGVPPDPAPVDLVPACLADQGAPQLDVLDRAGLPFPAPADP